MPEFITNILTGISQWVNGKIADVNTAIEGKQDALTAGANISIDSANTISVTGITASDVTNAVSSTSVMSIWKGTQNQYNAIVSPSDTTFYIIVEPLSLTITSGDTIQYDPNMTWAQWIGSSYNTLGWAINTDYVADSSGSSNVLFAGGNFVDKTDAINASLTYSFVTISEGGER